MAKGTHLNCQIREEATKGTMAELRRQGKVPGVIYGRQVPNRTVLFESAELKKVFHGKGTRGLFSLALAGENVPTMAILREVQKHPVNGSIIHVDFMKVIMSEKITAPVPVVVTGEEEITRTGGIVQTGVKEVEVSCLPGDLPESINLDIANWSIGDKMVVGDLLKREGVEFLTDPDTLLAVVLPPVRPEETAAAPAEEKAEKPEE